MRSRCTVSAVGLLSLCLVGKGYFSAQPLEEKASVSVITESPGVEQHTDVHIWRTQISTASIRHPTGVFPFILAKPE